MKILGLIPARAGSKGVRGKNLRPLLGRSLVERACAVGRTSAVLDRLVVSTDSEEIARHAAEFGAEVPFIRPDVLASDTAPMIDVVRHALGQLGHAGYRPGAVMLLQPTSPLRTVSHLRHAAEMLSAEATAVCSVVPIPQEICPHYVTKIEGGFLSFFLPEGERYTRRQDVPRAYRRDGTVYLTRTETLLRGSFFGDRCVPMILDPAQSVTIDSPEDWELAEHRLAARESGAASEASSSGEATLQAHAQVEG